MPCFASSLLDSNRRQRALQISAGPIGQGDYYQPVRCLVLVYDCSRLPAYYSLISIVLPLACFDSSFQIPKPGLEFTRNVLSDRRARLGLKNEKVLSSPLSGCDNRRRHVRRHWKAGTYVTRVGSANWGLDTRLVRQDRCVHASIDNECVVVVVELLDDDVAVGVVLEELNAHVELR